MPIIDGGESEGDGLKGNTFVACTALNCQFNEHGRCVLDRILIQQVNNGRELSCMNFKERFVPPEEKGVPTDKKFQNPAGDIIISLLPSLVARRGDK